MSTVDKAKLRELAEKAGAGEWALDGLDIVADTRELVCCGRRGYECCADPDVSGSPADAIATAWHSVHAEFIAAANPATVLALLDEIEALREKAEKFAIIERCMDQLECDEREGGIWTICTLLLIGSAHRLNSSNSVVTQEDVTVEGQDIGDWRVTVERISKGGSDRGR